MNRMVPIVLTAGTEQHASTTAANPNLCMEVKLDISCFGPFWTPFVIKKN